MKLPSKLTTFERFLYFDDYPAYPNTIGCRLILSGPLDLELFHRAVQLSSRQHPLLSTVLGRGGNRPAWGRYLEDPWVKQLPDDCLKNIFIKKIDLESEPGGQLHWAHADNTSSLNFLTHHATADGLGGLQAVFDFLAAYAGLWEARKSNDPHPERRAAQGMSRVDARLLNQRGSFGFGSWKFIRKIPRQLIGLFGVKEFFVNRPETLTAQRHGDVSDSIPADYPGLYTRELGDIELVQKKAGAAQVTSNELVLLAVFLGLAQWRKKYQFGREDDCLRLMVPINLRTIADRYLPAAHRSSMVTLDRVQSECRDSKALLDSIRFQMNVIKSNELGYTFLHMLNLFRWLPRGLGRFADPDRVGSTMVVTNLGEPFRRSKLARDDQDRLLVGDQVLEHIDLVAPLRPNTQAAIAIGRYARKTFLSLTYDNRCLDDEQARELTDLICEEFLARSH
jgi:hypothetical protein